MTQPPQIDAEDMERRLRTIIEEDHAQGCPARYAECICDREVDIEQIAAKALSALTTLRDEMQVLVDRVFELEEFAENVRHESCQALAGKDT